MTRRDPQLPQGPQKPCSARPIRATVWEYGNAVSKLADQLCRQELTALQFTARAKQARRELTAKLTALHTSIPASQMRRLNRAIIDAAASWAQGEINSSRARHLWKDVARQIADRAERRSQAAPCSPARL